MSEKFQESHNGNNELEHHSHESHSEALKQKHERELTKAEKEHGNSEQLEAIRKAVEKQAPVAHEVTHNEKEQHNNHPVIVNKQLKDMAFSRSMIRTRKKLSAPSRVFSKVIHNSVIDKSSEAVGKTVARPSSMLAGAFVTFVGTSALLWATRYYGYEYNYLVFILLFLFGAVVGIAIEVLWRLTHKNKNV